MVIVLSERELKKCIKFSYKCAKNQQRIEFGQRDVSERSISEIGRDNLIGKIAEVAFAKMLKEQFGIKIKLDFKFYPRGKWDAQDCIINGWKVDIKATRSGGRWLLIEWSKLNFRHKDDDLSHLYVVASVKWDRNEDLPQNEVNFVGYASINRLKPNVDKTLILRKGDYIPGTSTRLQADNYGIKFNDLRYDWDWLLNKILKEEPPNTDDYPNPYTGRSTKAIRHEK